MSGAPPSLAGLVGSPAAAARDRLGDPAADRPARPGRWLVWEGEGWRLRVRVGGGASAGGGSGPGGRGVAEGDAGAAEDRVTSWSLEWAEGRPTLRAALEPLGLWPAAAPDAAAAELEAPLARRGLEGPGGEARSLTATVRSGAFVRVAVFDEAPEW